MASLFRPINTRVSYSCHTAPVLQHRKCNQKKHLNFHVSSALHHSRSIIMARVWVTVIYINLAVMSTEPRHTGAVIAPHMVGTVGPVQTPARGKRQALIYVTAGCQRVALKQEEQRKNITFKISIIEMNALKFVRHMFPYI